MESVPESCRLAGLRNGLHRQNSKNAKQVATRNPVQPKLNIMLGEFIITQCSVDRNNWASGLSQQPIAA